jgi:hypothetical protein
VQISRGCTPPYLFTGLSNLLQPAEAEVVLGQRSMYLASWVCPICSQPLSCSTVCLLFSFLVQTHVRKIQREQERVVQDCFLGGVVAQFYMCGGLILWVFWLNMRGVMTMTLLSGCGWWLYFLESGVDNIKRCRLKFNMSSCRHQMFKHCPEFLFTFE